MEQIPYGNKGSENNHISKTIYQGIQQNNAYLIQHNLQLGITALRPNVLIINHTLKLLQKYTDDFL